MAFPTAELVRASAGLLTPIPGWDGSEGPRSRIVIGPGVLQVGRHDPAKAERTHERAVAAHLADMGQAALRILLAGPVCGAPCDHDSCRWLRRAVAPARGKIIAWSGKSRSSMVKTLAALDYAPLFELEGRVGMVTLTYPGEWESVAPDALTCRRHMDTFRKRFERFYGRPLVTIWKREFQRRGAPHYHMLMCVPGDHHGRTFRDWLSLTWASIVNHLDPVQRMRHELAGTGVDFAEGGRMTDPRRLAIYFSKHGSFAAKDYQNNAPELWQDAGSVGRFWGVWGLDKALATVEVTPAEALAAARTMRRWSRANGYAAPRPVWRSRAGTFDPLTGEVPRVWRRRMVTRPVKRMRGDSGFLTLNNAPGFVSQLYRHLDAVHLASTGELR